MDLPIIVPCYFQNEESHRLSDMEETLGVQLNVDLDTVYDVKSIYFFDISYVFEHPNGKDTMIGSGVEDFRSPMNIKEVLKLLK
jgi:hypothetical protein